MSGRILLAAAALVCAAVAPALAADREATLSSSATKYEWEGAPHLSRGAPLYNETARTSIPCGSGPARECEETLIRLTEPGKLTVKVDGLPGTGGTTDVDLYLYASDDKGTQGDKLGSSAANGPDTVTVTKAKAGYYLAVADYYHSYESGYKGVATFVSSTPPPPPPAPPVAEPAAAPAPQPAPQSQPAKKKPSAKAACQKRAKKIKSAKTRRAALKKCAKKR
jgi:hypothetical protein